MVGGGGVRRLQTKEGQGRVRGAQNAPRGHIVRVARAGPGQRARKAKVAQLEHARAAEQQVLGLNVAVNDLVLVQVVNAAHQLPHDLFGVQGVQALWPALQLLQQRALHKLKHQVQLAFAAKHVQQPHNVVVPQLLEDAHLAQRRLAHLLRLIRLLELFNGHYLPALLVPRLEHHPVRALAYCAQELKGLHPPVPPADGKQPKAARGQPAAEGGGVTSCITTTTAPKKDPAAGGVQRRKGCGTDLVRGPMSGRSHNPSLCVPPRCPLLHDIQVNSSAYFGWGLKSLYQQHGTPARTLAAWRKANPTADRVSLNCFGAAVKDEDLVHLRGVANVCMWGCTGLTDAGFAHLAGVRVVRLHGCNNPRLTHCALQHIRGARVVIMTSCGQSSLNSMGACMALEGVEALDISSCSQFEGGELGWLGKRVVELQATCCKDYVQQEAKRIMEANRVEMGISGAAAAAPPGQGAPQQPHTARQQLEALSQQELAAERQMLQALEADARRMGNAMAAKVFSDRLCTAAEVFARCRGGASGGGGGGLRSILLQAHTEEGGGGGGGGSGGSQSAPGPPSAAAGGGGGGGGASVPRLQEIKAPNERGRVPGLPDVVVPPKAVRGVWDKALGPSTYTDGAHIASFELVNEVYRSALASGASLGFTAADAANFYAFLQDHVVLKLRRDNAPHGPLEERNPDNDRAVDAQLKTLLGDIGAGRSYSPLQQFAGERLQAVTHAINSDPRVPAWFKTEWNARATRCFYHSKSDHGEVLRISPRVSPRDQKVARSIYDGSLGAPTPEALAMSTSALKTVAGKVYGADAEGEAAQRAYEAARAEERRQRFHVVGPGEGMEELRARAARGEMLLNRDQTPWPWQIEAMRREGVWRPEEWGSEVEGLATAQEEQEASEEGWRLIQQVEGWDEEELERHRNL